MMGNLHLINKDKLVKEIDAVSKEIYTMKDAEERGLAEAMTLMRLAAEHNVLLAVYRSLSEDPAP